MFLHSKYCTGYFRGPLLTRPLILSQVGHLPYLWQGALSLVSQTLLVMGATMSPKLAALMPPTISVEFIIAEVIAELNRLAHLAPSLKLSAEIVQEAEARRRTFFNAQESRS